MNKMKLILPSILTTLVLISGALAVSNNYYAKIVMYFNTPSDAAFQIAMPSDYTSYTSITSTSEGSPTATDWISFNFTAVPNTALVEPYQLGLVANKQDNANKKPIIYINNNGNVAETFALKAGGALPSNIGVYFNASGTGTPVATLTALTTGYQNIETNLAVGGKLNITLYANTSVGIATGQTTQDLIIKSTANA